MPRAAEDYIRHNAHGRPGSVTHTGHAQQMAALSCKPTVTSDSSSSGLQYLLKAAAKGRIPIVESTDASSTRIPRPSGLVLLWGTLTAHCGRAPKGVSLSLAGLKENNLKVVSDTDPHPVCNRLSSSLSLNTSRDRRSAPLCSGPDC